VKRGFFQSGLWMAVCYNAVPIITNAFVLLVTNLVIGDLLYDKKSVAIFQQYILGNSLNNFLVNILAFPLAMGTLLILNMPAFLVFRNASGPARETGLRRMLNGPFNVGLVGFLGWIFGATMARIIFSINNIDQWESQAYLATGTSVVSGALNFVLNFYILGLINRKFFIPVLFPDGGIQQVSGIRRLSLRFNLEIFVVAVATVPILTLGLSLVNIQGLVPAGQRPSYALSIGLVAGLLALGLMVSSLLSRSLRRPLTRMRNAAQSIQAGDFSVKLPADTTDEIGDLAVSINEMAAGLAEKEKINASFGRAVDPRVRDYLMKHGDALGGEQIEATILFSDIRGFTSFSESRDPREVVDWLNTYFERMARCVREHGGIVNKYVGDAILAVFNAPIPLANHVAAGYNCAVAMLAELEKLNAEMRAGGRQEIRIGIGIHTGTVVAGNIGSSERQEFTVIGDTVNTASRIESLCKKFKVPLLVSQEVYEILGSSDGLRKLGLAKVKGKSSYLSIFGK
jgi:adenylate cyclase